MSMSRRPPGRASNSARRRPCPCLLLAISSHDDDRAFLTRTFSGVRVTGTCKDGISALRDHVPRVVVTERARPDGGWRDIFHALDALPHRPKLIVVSRFADHGLWMEVLELGGYDVLPKPFEEREVIRVVNLALAEHGQALRGAG